MSEANEVDGVVMRFEYTNINHPSTVIVCKTMQEYKYMVSWCEDNGKGIPFLGEPKLPICISVSGKQSGWTDRMDRALYYKKFREFLDDIGA